MSLSSDLLSHALKLWSDFDAEPSDAALRRAVSACYYALFHEIKSDAVNLIAPNVPEVINHRIQRWFDHAEMKRVCGRFLNDKLDQPLLGLIGQVSSRELRQVCQTFVQLQDARHSADYDLGYSVTADECFEFIETAAAAITTWQSIKYSAEANIFILSLLLWKNWEEKERR